MKKLVISLIAMFSILAGTATVAVAKSNLEKLNVRFTENNVLLVTAPTLSEARLYSEDGLLLEREQGKFVAFELNRGTYLLFADVESGTEVRKVVLK